MAVNPHVALADVVLHRRHRPHDTLTHRLALTAETLAEARDQPVGLRAGRAAAPGRGAGQPGVTEAPRVAFLFTGQGAQLAGLGRQLYATQPTFRRALDRCAAVLATHCSISRCLTCSTTRRTQRRCWPKPATRSPLLFAARVGAGRAVAELGRCAGALLGHSLGEYVAACRAGVFSLEDGLRLVVARGELMETAGHGAMLAVFAPPERLAPALAPHTAAVSIAAINGPTETVLAGERDAVEAFRQALAAQGLSCRVLPSQYAFHSPLLDPVLDPMAKAAAGVNFHPPQLPLMTNLTGTAAVEGDLTTAAYWRRQAREPVLFGQGLETLRAAGCTVFIEIGPQATLLRLGQRLSGAENALWLPSLDPQRDDWSQLLESLGRLYTAGVNVDWPAFDRDYSRRRLAHRVPTYPFQRERHWFEPKAPQPVPAQPERRSLLGRRLSSPVIKAAVFEAVNRSDSPGFFADHRVGTTVVVPGAGYAVMLLEAARQSLAASQYRAGRRDVHRSHAAPRRSGPDNSGDRHSRRRRQGRAADLQPSGPCARGRSLDPARSRRRSRGGTCRKRGRGRNR